MKSASSLVAICLTVMLAFSFAVVLREQKEGTNVDSQFDLLTYSDGLNLPTILTYHNTFAERAPLPDNTTRANILGFIQSNPGVQFRAICSSLGLSVGVVQFHIAVLEKNDFINSLFKGKYKRFFIAGKFTRKEMEIIATLKLETPRNILKTLLEGKHAAHHGLATKLSITSQGLTWQMNRLQQTGLIEEDRKGLNVSYSINANCTTLLLQTISFIEKT